MPAAQQITNAMALKVTEPIKADDTQWVHVLASGTVLGKDGRGPYTLIDPDDVINKTRQYHGKCHMLVDYEHQSIDAQHTGKPAPAAGWITGLQTRADGIWAFIRWTAPAAQMIRQRAYRYVSPVFQHDQNGKINRLINVALTNSPNLDLTAMARSELKMDQAQLEELRNLLGLPDEADFTAIKDAITGLLQSANHTRPDLTKFVPIGDFERVVAEGNKLRMGISQQAAETHVNALITSGSLAPFLKDWAINLCSVNKPQLDSFMERTGPFFTQITAPQRAGSYQPKPPSKLNDDQLAVCRTMGLTEAEFINAYVGE